MSRLPRSVGNTVVSSTEDLVTLLRDVLEALPSADEMNGIEDDNSSLEAKVDELKEEIEELKKENEKLTNTILGLRSDKEAINNVAKHLAKKLPKKVVK